MVKRFTVYRAPCGGGGRRGWRRPQWRPTRRRAPGEIARVEGELEAEGGGRVLNGEGVWCVQWQLSVVRTSPRLASAAAAAARTRRRRSLARRLATRLAADVRCARPTVRSVACAALRAALRALLRLHCLSLLLLVVVMVLLLVQMLLLARRGSATGLDARVASV